jgi:hypothetical protein
VAHLVRVLNAVLAGTTAVGSLEGQAARDLVVAASSLTHRLVNVAVIRDVLVSEQRSREAKKWSEGARREEGAIQAVGLGEGGHDIFRISDARRSTCLRTV